ncbi:MAG: hypothetical protein KAH72_05070, partial [Flavobacteriaceae bacterium]|nr:hypothetical protein [Flavobacteriaceae bacterium]
MTNNKFIKISRIFLFGLIILSFSTNTYSQSIVEINIEEAKTKAKENNTNLKISHQDYAIAKANYE